MPTFIFWTALARFLEVSKAALLGNYFGISAIRLKESFTKI
jgi:hypothetical protein